MSLEVRSEASRRRSARGAMAWASAAAAWLLLAGHATAEEAEREELVPSANRAIVTLQPPGSAPDSLRRMELERGKSAVLRSVSPVKRIAVGDPAIADVVALGPNEFHVVAKKIGDTNVVLWSTDGSVIGAVDLHVGRPHSQIENELRHILENDSIRADGAGESVVLKGTVSSPAEMERAVAVANAFFPAEKKDAPQRVISMLEVGGNQQVMLEVVLAEMSRSVRRNLGTNFAGVSQTAGTDVQIFSLLQNLTSLDPGNIIKLSSQLNLVATIANGTDQLDIFMEAIQENGLAKILAEPNLVARSGEKAHFLVGGEVPIPVPQSGAIGVITIEYKEFGVGLTFTPTVMGKDRIHLAMTAEVSEPDLTLGARVSGFVVPAFTTRRAATGIELGDGQSFAVAGLLREDLKELAHQFPFIGDIPVLGALFRSTRFEKNETELVMIVTPHLVKPLPPGPPALPTDHFVEPNAFEYFFLGSLEGDYAANLTSDAVALWDRAVGASQLAGGQGGPPGGAAAGEGSGELREARGGLEGGAGHRVNLTFAQEDK